MREALRVLRPGGVIAAAAISRYLAALEIGSSPGLDPQRIQLARQIIETGRYEPFLGFTSAHWHRPEELREEMIRAGFVDAQVLGIEGPEWVALDTIGLNEFEEHVDEAIAVAELLEADPAVMSVRAHLLGLATA